MSKVENKLLFTFDGASEADRCAIPIPVEMMLNFEPCGVTINIIGKAAKESAEYLKSFKRKLDNKRAALRNRGDKNWNKELDPDEDEAFEINLLKVIVKSWDIKTKDGKAVPCDPDNIETVFKGYPSFKTQVMEVWAESKNFMIQPQTL